MALTFLTDVEELLGRGNLASGQESSVAELKNGQFVVVTESRVEGLNGIYAQIYNSDGTTEGDLFRVHNDENPNRLEEPMVTGLADGGFVVAWERDGDIGGVNSYFKLYDDTYAAASGVQRLHAPNENNNFLNTLTAAGDGFAAAGRSGDDLGTDRIDIGVLVRFFGADGVAEDGETWLNTQREGIQAEATSTTLEDGNIVFFYETDEGGAGDLVYQLRGPSGAVIVGETRLSTPPVYESSPEVAALDGNRFVVIFGANPAGSREVYAQIFEVNTTGAGTTVGPVGDRIEVNLPNDGSVSVPQVVGTAGEGFFATWIESVQGAESFERLKLMGRFFDGAGAPIGEPEQIARGDFGSVLQNDLAESNTGAILATWNMDSNPDPDGIFIESHYRLIEAPVEAADLDQLIRGDETPNELDGGAGNDTILGFEANDLLRGLEGDDLLEGASGNDTLEGGAGNDTLDGGSGRDRMAGGAGDDTYRVDDRRDVVTEAAAEGIDEIISSAAVILGGAEVERVTLTGAANARVLGNGTATEITGNSGSNILAGGGGGDTLTGGGGVDYFVLQEQDAPGVTSFTDFDDLDILALDDRFFGLGDGRVDARAVDPDVAARALARGTVEYDRASGELHIRGELVADLGDGTRLGVDDVLLF